MSDGRRWAAEQEEDERDRAARSANRRPAIISKPTAKATVKDSLSDRELKVIALRGYANWIETGDFNLSARDAARVDRQHNVLSIEQMKMVVRLHELADEVQQ